MDECTISNPTKIGVDDRELNATIDTYSTVIAPIDNSTAATNTNLTVDTPFTSNTIADTPSVAVDSVEVSAITAAWNVIDIKIRDNISNTF